RLENARPDRQIIGADEDFALGAANRTDGKSRTILFGREAGRDRRWRCRGIGHRQSQPDTERESDLEERHVKDIMLLLSIVKLINTSRMSRRHHLAVQVP